jgi:hypothetical protein
MISSYTKLQYLTCQIAPVPGKNNYYSIIYKKEKTPLLSSEELFVNLKRALKKEVSCGHSITGRPGNKKY